MTYQPQRNNALRLGLLVAVAILLAVILVFYSAFKYLDEISAPAPPDTPPPSVVRSFEQQIARSPLTLEQASELTERRFALFESVVRGRYPAMDFEPPLRETSESTRCVDGPVSRAARPSFGPVSAPISITDEEWQAFPQRVADEMTAQGVHTDVAGSEPPTLRLVIDDEFEIRFTGKTSLELIVLVYGPCALPSVVRDEVRAGG